MSAPIAKEDIELEESPIKILPSAKDVSPVPPLATAKVPPNVNVPVVVIGLAVSLVIVIPVVPPSKPTLVTVPDPDPA